MNKREPLSNTNGIEFVERIGELLSPTSGRQSAYLRGLKLLDKLEREKLYIYKGRQNG